jgi:hypothetical protein
MFEAQRFLMPELSLELNLWWLLNACCIGNLKELALFET